MPFPVPQQPSKEVVKQLMKLKKLGSPGEVAAKDREAPSVRNLTQAQRKHSTFDRAMKLGASVEAMALMMGEQQRRGSSLRRAKQQVQPQPQQLQDQTQTEQKKQQLHTVQRSRQQEEQHEQRPAQPPENQQQQREQQRCQSSQKHSEHRKLLQCLHQPHHALHEVCPRQSQASSTTMLLMPALNQHKESSLGKLLRRSQHAALPRNGKPPPAHEAGEEGEMSLGQPAPMAAVSAQAAATRPHHSALRNRRPSPPEAEEEGECVVALSPSVPSCGTSTPLYTTAPAGQMPRTASMPSRLRVAWQQHQQHGGVEDELSQLPRVGPVNGSHTSAEGHHHSDTLPSAASSRPQSTCSSATGFSASPPAKGTAGWCPTKLASRAIGDIHKVLSVNPAPVSASAVPAASVPGSGTSALASRREQKKAFLAPSSSKEQQLSVSGKGAATSSLSKSSSCPVLPQATTLPSPAVGPHLAPLQDDAASPPSPRRGSIDSKLEFAAGKHRGTSVCPFVEISASGIDKLVEACQFGGQDLVYDIGCGKGNVMDEILRRYPCRGVAVDINSSLARSALKRLSKYGPRCRVLVGDIRLMDLSEATAVVTFFITPAADKVKSHFATKLKPGSLWLNYAWPVPGWQTSRPPTDSVYRYIIGQHLAK